MRDIAFILDRTEDLNGYHIVRMRGAEEPVEVGTLRPLREGKPVDGELVSLRPRTDIPFAFDVKTELADERQAAARESKARLTGDGPAQVATPEYRKGWEVIWGTQGPGLGSPSAKPN